MKKHLLIIFSVVSLFVGLVIAIPPASQYNPGETLDPICSPGAPNCSVDTNDHDWEKDTSNGYVYNLNDKIGVGIAAPTAFLHLPAGTTTAASAPLKFSSGVNLGTPETGAIEFSGASLYFTPAATRKTFAFVEDLGGGGANEITDADDDTKIQIEESADEDMIRFDTAGTERMIIDETGNVGIGTSDPNNALDVIGDIGIRGSNNRIEIVDGQGITKTFRIGSHERLVDPISNIVIEGSAGYTDLDDSSFGAALYNTSIGFEVMEAQDNGGVFDGYNNVGIGNFVMWNRSGGSSNVGIGDAAMQHGISGNRNVAVGYRTLDSLNNGSSNIAIGDRALYHTASTNGNIGLGTYCGWGNTGSANVYIGPFSGYGHTGSSSIFLGDHADGNITGDYKLVINAGESAATAPLIYGEFDNDYLKINGELEVTETIKIGDTVAVCNGTTEGHIRYDSAGNHFYGCDGSTWKQLDN